MYEALDGPTTSLLESMCQGKFMEKDEDEGWEFFEEFAEKTMLWESIREPTREPERHNDSVGYKLCVALSVYVFIGYNRV